MVEVYTEPTEGTYGHVERVKPGGSIAPRAFPDVVLAVSDLIR